MIREHFREANQVIENHSEGFIPPAAEFRTEITIPLTPHAEFG